METSPFYEMENNGKIQAGLMPLFAHRHNIVQNVANLPETLP